MRPSDRSPVFSPDGRTLLFVSDRTNDNNDIWRVGVGGSGLKRLTTSGDDDARPDWSPDGRRIVYSSYHFASYDLYTMSPTGGSRKTIANDLSNDVQPQWSPDGRRIAFVRTCQEPELCMTHAANRRDGAGELYVLNLAAGAQRGWGRRLRPRAILSGRRTARRSPSSRRSAPIPTSLRSGRPARGCAGVRANARPDLDPQWSPDGRKIAFTRSVRATPRST